MLDPVLSDLADLAVRPVSRSEAEAAELLLADALACAGSAVAGGLAGSALADGADLALAMSARDLDDVDWSGIHHPGSVIISSALATACKERRGGEELAAALVAGYRVAAVVAHSLDPGFRSRWHATAVCGSLGACVAAMYLNDPSPQALERALSLVSTSVGGLAIAPRARNGAAMFTRAAATSLALLATRGALEGLAVAPEAFGGPGGLAQTLTGKTATSIVEPPASGVLSASLRLFPITGFGHAAVWAARLPSAHGDIRDVERIEVQVSPATAAMARADAWWDIAAAVGRTVITGDPFTCAGPTDVPFPVTLEAADLPVDRARLQVVWKYGSSTEWDCQAPGSLGVPETIELFSRKSREVLGIDSERCLATARSTLTAGAVAPTTVRQMLPID